MLVPEDYIAPKILRFSDVQMYVHQKCSPERSFFFLCLDIFFFISFTFHPLILGTQEGQEEAAAG